MNRISRRRFLQLAGGAGALGLAPGLSGRAARAQAPAPVAPEQAHAPPRAALQFFNDRQAAFVHAVVDHFIPADGSGPSASQAGVVHYIDLQLAGAYGHGHRLYLQGPWRLGTSQQGYQLRLTPREMYALGIAAVEDHVRSQGLGERFAALAPTRQVQLLEALENGDIELDPMPAPVLFETLLANTIEGYFADPAYGGNRNMDGWRLVGFPGAYAAYVHEVGMHGRPFLRPPMAMTQSVHGPHE